MPTRGRHEKKGGQRRSERQGEDRGDISQVSPVSLTKHLRGVDFPASKQDLLERVRSANVGDEVIQQIERLPDQEYQNMADVMKGFGQTNE